MVKLLVEGFFANINEKNSEGKTALDIALLRETVEPRSMVYILRGAGAVEISSSLANDNRLAKFSNSPELSLKVAAETGDIDLLYQSIDQDPNVLERIDAISFVDAASSGHICFAVEILRLKPSFGRKLNPDGLSSLHLALINHKLCMAKRLIKLDKELIRVKGKQGETPLHFVAKKEYGTADQQKRELGDYCIDILAEFLFACPDSIEDLTNRDKSALHIAVKARNERAVKVILGLIRRTNKESLLGQEDDEGSTALDIAKSFQTDEGESIVKSFKGTSYFGLVRSTMLFFDWNVDPSESYNYSTLAEFLSSPEEYWEILHKSIILSERYLSMELRNLVIVVAALIATATFQAVLSPPGGLGDGDKNLLTNGTNFKATVLSTNNLFAANTSFINATFFTPSDDPVKQFLFKNVNGEPEGPTYGNVFSIFYGLNTCAFLLSIATISVLVKIPFFSGLNGALFLLMLSYGISFRLISPSYGYSKTFMTLTFCLGGLLYLSTPTVLAMKYFLSRHRRKRMRMLKRLLNNIE